MTYLSQKNKIIDSILDRADKHRLLWKDKITLFMDLDNADLDWGLLDSFDDDNFYHDIIGIQNNMNRKTGQLDQHFLPRSGV
jgi:hypothetical protein